MQKLAIQMWKVLVGYNPKTQSLLNEWLQMHIYSMSKKNNAKITGYLFCCTKISSITNSVLLYLIEWSKQTNCVMIFRTHILLSLTMTKW